MAKTRHGLWGRFRPARRVEHDTASSRTAQAEAGSKAAAERGIIRLEGTFAEGLAHQAWIEEWNVRPGSYATGMEREEANRVPLPPEEELYVLSRGTYAAGLTDRQVIEETNVPIGSFATGMR